VRQNRTHGLLGVEVFYYCVLLSFFGIQSLVTILSYISMYSFAQIGLCSNENFSLLKPKSFTIVESGIGSLQVDDTRCEVVRSCTAHGGITGVCMTRY
jgi:hypothetical protein